MASSTIHRRGVDVEGARVHPSRDFTRILMQFQRATHLISSTLDLECLLDRVVNEVAATLGNIEVSLWLRDDGSGAMVLHGVKGCSRFHKGHHLESGRGMVGQVVLSGEMRYAPDVRLDPYYIACEPATRSEATIPLKVAGRLTGVLCIDHAQVNAFSSDQLAVLQALAEHIAIAVENAKAFQYEREERERMQKESADARAMQEAIFLKPVPLVPGFAFETAWHPAGAVAGDWFDFIDLGQQRYGVALADVSGKGMSAALLMAATRALLRSIAPAHTSPAATLEHLSRILAEDFPMGKFVTMVYGVLDAGARTLTVASAGHPRPLVKNGSCRFLELEPGLPLGLGASGYEEQALMLSAGTHVLFYSDGITEAANLEEEEFGLERLSDHFLQADGCVQSLISKVQSFSVGSKQIDDATAVLIRSR